MTTKVEWTHEAIIEAIQAWAAEHRRPPTATNWNRSSPEHPTANTVDRRFGSWKAAIVAAGFPPPRPAPGEARRYPEGLSAFICRPCRRVPLSTEWCPECGAAATKARIFNKPEVDFG